MGSYFEEWQCREKECPGLYNYVLEISKKTHEKIRKSAIQVFAYNMKKWLIT